MHIADIVNLVKWEELSEIILCGHSYGGCVVRGASEELGDRIASVIYVDAYLPKNGESLMDLFPVAQVEDARRMVREMGNGWKIAPLPAAAFNVNPNDAAWVDAQCTPQSLASFEEKIKLSKNILPVRGGMYISAMNYTPPSAIAVSRARADANGWRTESLQCGHDIMIDLPQELSQLLLEFA
jgi:pimeloyl-ACP methyl ester carboxylesterase